MMSRKITAWVIILLVIIFPFRKAFLSGETPGIMMMLSFVVTLVGIGIFYYLMSTSDNKSEH
jgi:fatty-acid desaturase